MNKREPVNEHNKSYQTNKPKRKKKVSLLIWNYKLNRSVTEKINCYQHMKPWNKTILRA